MDFSAGYPGSELAQLLHQVVAGAVDKIGDRSGLAELEPNNVPATDRLLIFGERHLLTILAEYETRCNGRRSHRGRGRSPRPGRASPAPARSPRSRAFARQSALVRTVPSGRTAHRALLGLGLR